MRGVGQTVQSGYGDDRVGWGADIPRMSVIPFTIFFSLLLAGLFIVLFACEQRRRRFASTERDSLLPLADETARTVGEGENRALPGLQLREAPVPPAAPVPPEDPYPESIYF